VLRHVLDGHPPGQLQGVTLEGLGVAATRIGKRQRHLANDLAGTAFDPRDGQHDGDRFVADRHGLEGAGFVAVVDDVAGGALRAAAGVRALLDGEDDAALGEFGLGVVIAAQTKGMIQ
jgi:hypothetical protein